jgi:prephenate dehydrogenase
MTITIARYALWILLCIPVFVLGFGLLGDLLDGVLRESRAKKAKRDAKNAKDQKRQSFESEYKKTHGTER